ncbi:hypothetical protein PRUPE_4G233200 [Prunus persica]|uniref:Leucine-rich repeat-containing N-terminal plant-type domain-containing protein n=1 Tax=Prunus persica TaxID=3760 RepID=A0A251PPU5_PRUPE|nr:hypothetical protein PRUPE_4G233200 [Prunus persica]
MLFNTCSSFNSSSSLSSRHLCHPDDSSTLLQFKNSFYSNGTIFWEKGKDCCEWSGVTCGKVTGHVIGLNLGLSGLQGNIHSNSSLFFLHHLERLDLSDNDFRVPLEISHLSNLVSLNLSLPGVRLDTLSFNRIAQNLTNLRELNLYTVDMSSVVPDSFNNLSSSLNTLRLSRCNLQEKFPESIFRRPNLRSLYLGYNRNLTGYFPKSNWSSSLETLRLSYTRISVDWHHLTRNLKSLRDLSLRNCSFVGPYPALPGNLTQIMQLDLSHNGFGGQIPWSLLKFERLTNLDLSGNNYVEKQQVVPIPRHLTELDLFENLLNGTIPSWLGSLPSLEVLSVGSNQLSGDIIEFQSSHSLTRLDFSDNKLHGLIPRSIFELEKVTAFDLSSNNLSGIVEFENFSKLQSLSYLNLSSNHLSLSFHHFSNNTWPQLSILALLSCNISEFPYFLRASPNLETLDLSHNKIQGKVPKWLSAVVKDSLRQLDLSYNFFTGGLPIPPPSTFFFFISNNQLTGEMPPTICSLSRLQILDLSNNKLSGKIHQCLGDFSQSLSVLDLRKNKFDGMIPMTFSKGNVLRNLGLDGNQLEGPLPPSLLTCRDLEVLDVGNNKIHDTFPNWLESLPKLQVLILRSNKFHGAIGNPTSKFPFQKLCIMDLSHNLFNGLLPTKYFENLAAMINSQEHELKYMGEGYYHDTVVVTVKGFEIEMVKIQTFFTSIDFSNNSFIGEISNVIGKLKSLKGLNFSNNELTSTIPPSFGELSNLEWLDLSSNGLVGEIPGQLANLTSLSSGNTGLCGLPLSKTCGAHQSPPSSFRQEGDLEHWNGFDWKVVLMGYASGVVIGISVAYLVLSNGQPNWLVKVIGRKQHRKTVKITQRRA